MSPVFQNPMIQKITFYVGNFHSVSSNRDFKMGKQNGWEDRGIKTTTSQSTSEGISGKGS